MSKRDIERILQTERKQQIRRIIKSVIWVIVSISIMLLVSLFIYFQYNPPYSKIMNAAERIKFRKSIDPAAGIRVVGGYEKVDQKILKDNGVLAYMVIMEKGADTSVYIELDKGEFYTTRDSIPILIQFDDGQPTPWHCDKGDGGFPATLILRKRKLFTSKLRLAKTVTIEARFPSVGDKLMVFDVTGLMWK